MKWFIRNLCLFSNWPEIYSLRLRKGMMTTVTLQLRNGLKIVIPSLHDLPIVHEIFGEKVYGGVKGDIIMDVGGNTGCFSLYARMLNPTAQIHVYEPNPEILPYLRKNVGHDKKIQIHPYGLGKEKGEFALFSNHGGDSGHASLFKLNKNDTATLIQTETLDNELRTLGKVDFMKIDIETAEYDVVKASKLAETNISIIVSEGAGQLGELLQEREYDVNYTKGDHLTLVAYKKNLT